MRTGFLWRTHPYPLWRTHRWVRVRGYVLWRTHQSQGHAIEICVGVPVLAAATGHSHGLDRRQRLDGSANGNVVVPGLTRDRRNRGVALTGLEVRAGCQVQIHPAGGRIEREQPRDEREGHGREHRPLDAFTRIAMICVSHDSSPFASVVRPGLTTGPLLDVLDELLLVPHTGVVAENCSRGGPGFFIPGRIRFGLSSFCACVAPAGLPSDGSCRSGD